MPTLVANVLLFAGANAGTALAVAGFVSEYGLLVGGLAYSSYKAKQAKRQARDQYNAQQVDRLVSTSSAVAPRELVLGRVRKAGVVFFSASNGNNSRDFYRAVAIAAHEIDAVEAYYFNDQLVEVDGAGNVLTAPYAGFAVIKAHLGAPGQTVGTLLNSGFGAEWPASYTVEGVAWLECQFTYNESIYTNGPPAVSVVMRGAKLYDPRTTLTVWSDNPALMMRHVYQHAKFGKATVTAAEDARITAAANACDTSTNYVVGGVTEVNKLYRAALVLPFGTAANAALDDLAQAMGGSWCFAGGELYVKAGTFTASVMTLTDADLAVVKRNGATETQVPIQISVHKERAQKFNTVKAIIWDAGQDYKQSSLTPLVGSALLTRDGVELVQEITMPAVGYAPQALHVAGITMRDARDALTVELPFKLRAYPIEIFDTVSLTLSRYGWSAKTFMVINRTWSADGSLSLAMKETTATITQMDSGFAAQGFARNTNLPDPLLVEPMGVLAITSGTAELIVQGDGTVISRMRVTWPAVQDISVTGSGLIEVQYRQTATTGAWASLFTAGDATQIITSEVQDGLTYDVRARMKNSFAQSEWSAVVVHTVLGKTERPPDVDALFIDGTVLGWTPVVAADLAGYKVRYVVGTQVNWAAGQALHQGLLTESPYQLPAPLPGLNTFMVVAVDTSGNESVMVASVASTGALQLAGNTLESWPQAPLFEGAITGGTVVAGELESDSTGALFWGASGNLHWLGDAELYWGASSYLAMAYQFAVGISADGVLVIESEIEGNVVTIEMRRPSDALAWTTDGAAFWVSDPAPYWTASDYDWEPWPGQLVVLAGQFFEFRVITTAGPTQGRIAVLTPYLDVPTVEDYIDDATISATGTRLTLNKTFRAIKNIQLTVQQDGGSAITARWVDKLVTGPLVETLDATGLVAGTVDARVKGY